MREPVGLWRDVCYPSGREGEGWLIERTWSGDGDYLKHDDLFMSYGRMALFPEQNVLAVHIYHQTPQALALMAGLRYA